jgi:hypothetical protein
MSNRSLAAARSRRSPQEVVSSPGIRKDPNPHPPSRMAPPNGAKQPGKAFSNEESSSSVNTLPSKLSVSDAIGLITIRLSKVESHLLKEQHEGSKSSHTNSNISSVTDVDTALRNLVSRVHGLEKAQNNLDQNFEELSSMVRDLEGSTQVNELLPSTPATDPLLLERLEKTEKDLSELKQLVIKLQTMLIDVTMAQKFSASPIPAQTPAPAPAPLPSPTNPSFSVDPATVEEQEGEEYEQEVTAGGGSMRLDI